MNVITRSRADHLIGTYRTSTHEYRVTVTIELRDGNVAPFQTTKHESVTSAVQELSITANVDERSLRGDRWRDWSGGQCREDVASVTRFAEGWDRAKLDQLLAVWDEWHLNGMCAACDHMVPAPIDSSVLGVTVGRMNHPESLTLDHYTINKALVCPESGYRYGQSWLVRTLPESVVEWALKLNGEGS